MEFETALSELREIVQADAPHLLPLYSTFAQEARFGRRWLAPNLDGLAPGASILEVGAGLMLLSSQLIREGFTVTALEPIGTGFSAFAELQAIVLAYSRGRGIAPRILACNVEDLEEARRYDFAFSINVMEHVDNVPGAVRRILDGLRPGATYRFVCPNYSFPYEPHFDMLTLFSKRLTGRLRRRDILNNQIMADPEGMWQSLNWITVGEIKKAVAEVRVRSLDSIGTSSARPSWGWSMIPSLQCGDPSGYACWCRRVSSLACIAFLGYFRPMCYR